MKMTKLPLTRPILRQLIEFNSHTYTYLLGCEKTRKAVIIDPVFETVDRDISIAKDLQLDLVYGLNTHVHADHVTGTHAIKKAFPKIRSVLSKASGGVADAFVSDSDRVEFGDQTLEVRATPGHTNGCVTYVSHALRAAFTGDALLIRSCGRTDFQQGDSRKLYESVTSRIFTLPDDYILYVCHNYDGVLQTTVFEEKRLNPRLTKGEDAFVEFMANLKLPYPKQIDRAVPLNMKDGATAEQLV